MGAGKKLSEVNRGIGKPGDTLRVDAQPIANITYRHFRDKIMWHSVGEFIVGGHTFDIFSKVKTRKKQNIIIITGTVYSGQLCGNYTIRLSLATMLCRIYYNIEDEEQEFIDIPWTLSIW